MAFAHHGVAGSRWLLFAIHRTCLSALSIAKSHDLLFSVMVLQVGNIRISAFCSLQLQAVACRACVVLDAYCKPESWSHRTLSWEGPNLSGSHPALLAWHYLAAEVVRRRVTLCWRAWTKIPKMLRSMAQPSNLNLTGHSMARQCALLSFSSSLPASPGKPDPQNSSCVDLPTNYPHREVLTK